MGLFSGAPDEIHTDPVALCHWMWPHDIFYSKEREVIMAVKEAAEVYCQAGNELGKDWVLGRICVSFWVCPWAYYGPEWFRNIDKFAKPGMPEYVNHKRRVVTTSVKDKHLDVLWAEIGTAWRTCRVDLNQDFLMTHREVRFREEANAKNAASYMIGVVSGSENLEGLTGHHAAYTLGCGDEASGLNDRVQDAFSGWAKRMVFIGNPLPCETFYKRNCRAGDLLVA